jgi:hypothetical protein
MSRLVWCSTWAEDASKTNRENKKREKRVEMFVRSAKVNSTRDKMDSRNKLLGPAEPEGDPMQTFAGQFCTRLF